ncbi:MAG: type II toxin-antitoxin system HigB family toxin [Pirellulaceae bacterium]|nr:type II toxin-antitoxin system HigB family toxin [Pirellulaceae bacterium]
MVSARPEASHVTNSVACEASTPPCNEGGRILLSNGTASILQGSRVVFNICGNKYRLVVKINYPHQVMTIRFLGTHEKYDAVDAETI